MFAIQLLTEVFKICKVIKLNAFVLVRWCLDFSACTFRLRRCRIQEGLYGCRFEVYGHLIRLVARGILRATISVAFFHHHAIPSTGFAASYLILDKILLLVRRPSKGFHWACWPNVGDWISSYKLHSTILVLIVDKATATPFLVCWWKFEVNQWATLRGNSATADVWGGYGKALLSTWLYAVESFSSLRINDNMICYVPYVIFTV